MIHKLLSASLAQHIKRAVANRDKLIRSGKIDPWEGSNETIRKFRPALDSLSKKISNLDPEVIQTRFNPETEEIELYRRESRYVIAKVRFIFDCNDTRAQVWVMPEMLQDFRDRFTIALQMEVVFSA